MGTPHCESLASYAMRLAEAHCLDVGALIYRFIHPLTGSAWKDSRSQRSVYRIDRADLGSLTPAHVHIGKWLDMSNETQATVSALAELTKRPDLHLLTTLPLKGYVKKDSVLRFQRAWCPVCHQEQRISGQPVHDLLIWSFLDVYVCRRHGRRLRTSCYWCSSKQPILRFWSQPGQCGRCGIEFDTEDTRSYGPTFEEAWKADVIGDLLSKWNKLEPGKRKRPPTLERVLTSSYSTGDIMESLLPQQ
ncbi:TniQ family protein [Nodosilinea nodulosa]|uniref:TniQ family protein n=1 Tax=Nodosilinea nodulosa TaxID=416001 RepID=UPI001CEC4A30